MKNQKSLFFVFLPFVFTTVLACMAVACKKVVHVDLKDTPPRIVIEGNITNLPGAYQVQLTQTVDFDADNTFPGISGAEVKVTDSSAFFSETLTETAPGIYTGNILQGFPTHVYGLSVKVAGQQYSAHSTMPLAVQLDSVGFSKDLDLNNKPIIEAVVYFKDPEGVGNAYQFTETVNGRLLDPIFVFNDRLSDGKYFSQILFTDSAYLKVGDSLQLQMYCIDPSVYNYFYTLSQIAGDNNSTQSATPANPISNISNGALGYFSAHTVIARTLRVY